MSKFIRFILVPLILGLAFGMASAQTTTVSGTVTDPDSFNWVAGVVQFQIYNPQGGTVTSNGVPLTADQQKVTLTMNGSGTFSGAVLDNTLLQPVGTQWDLQACPAASSPCQTLSRVTVSGASQSLTSTINSQLKALRFPASYTARAYGQIEISPLPPAGGTYYDLTLAHPLFWNGTTWVEFGGNGAPHAPAGSVQVANSGVSALDSSSFFLIDTTTNHLTSTGYMLINSMESVPRRLYDPMDTKYLGGLAAAIAGTSGHTPVQVINAAIDFAECQSQPLANGGANLPGAMLIKLPSVGQIFGNGIKVWSGMELSGDSVVVHPNLQQVDGTSPLVTGHSGSDTLTCNGHTITPGGASGVLVRNLGIAGLGGFGTAANDQGIVANGQAWLVEDIQGAGNAFGEQAYLDAGFNNSAFRLGYPGSQLAGCVAYIQGFITPPSPTFPCGSVEVDSIDSELHYVYATDTGENLAGKAAGPCYPACGAIALNGANVEADNLFGQVSDIDVNIVATQFRVNMVRADATSREGVRIANFVSGIISDIEVTGPCLDTGLATAFNAGTPTGCAGTTVFGQSNYINGVVTINGGFFGQSFTQCNVFDGVSGSNTTPNRYTGIVNGTQGNPANTTRNSGLFCGAFTGDVSTGQVDWPSQTPTGVGALASINVNGITAVSLATGTPLTNMVEGIGGQTVKVYGVPGATVAQGGNIATCSGLPQVLSQFPTEFVNIGGYNDGAGNPNNIWRQICNTPNPTPWHVNYAGNPTPTLSAFQSVYGNTQSLKQPAFNLDVSQIHGTPIGTQACFTERALFPDGSTAISNLACTNIDLATQTPGEIFITGVTNALIDIYMNTNAQPNGIATGLLPHQTNGFYSQTVIAAGGDGSTPPVPNDTNTGSAYLDFGIRGPASAPSGTCSPADGGYLIVSQDGHGTFCPVGGGTWTTKF